MSMLSLLFTVAILGVIAWVVMQMPVPQPFWAVMVGIVVICLLLLLAQALGVAVPVLR